jgi:2,4-dienoyl-CoA reductase-like NADH-dependent reductase (Old Yellow Enzyme family)
MTEAEIEETIARFATSATLAKKAGFTGVQIHGAHGYLVSQFLSPRHNQREDRWGGSPENRRRFVLEVYRAIRAAVGPDFPVGIKLNSADFQRGGFTEEESMDVVEALAAAGIDLIEVSGGTYEAPVAVTGAKPTERTRQREAYFLEYAEKVRARVSIPIVVTGGFRSGKAMKEALQSGAMDMIGLARTLAVQPDLPNRLFAQEDYTVELPRPTTGIKALDLASMLDITWYEAQLERIGSGRPVKADLCPWVAVGQSFARMGLHAFRPRRA